MSEERVKEIRKAIKLLGWIEVHKRIKNPEDRKIFTELEEEFEIECETETDKILKKHKIKF